MNENSRKLVNGTFRRFVIGAIAVIVVIAVVAVIVARVSSDETSSVEPSADDSIQVICAMRQQANAPLIDDTKSNTRQDLAKTLSDRATAMQVASEKTGGDIREVLSNYASAMKKIADSISADTTGASLAEVIGQLATDKSVASAEETLKSILETRCK